MPEIWLNYGNNDVVLDILAENLDEKPALDSKTMDESEINEKLESIDPVSYTHLRAHET